MANGSVSITAGSMGLFEIVQERISPNATANSTVAVNFFLNVAATAPAAPFNARQTSSYTVPNLFSLP